MADNLTPDSVMISTGPSQSITPTGNPVSTLTSLGVQATTQSSTEREYLVTFSFTSNKGSGEGTPNGNKATLYSDIVLESGCGDGWAFNPLLAMNASSGSYNAQTIECDLNNNNANRGETSGSGGLSAPVAYGLSVTGSGSFRSTSALLVSGPGSSTIWNRGICFASGSIAQATFQDLTTSTTSIDIEGSHTYGLDLSNGTFSNCAMRLGNGQSISWLNAAGTSTDAEVQFNNGNNLVLGLAGAGAVVLGANSIPISDNTYICGQGTSRWSSVWAVNGTIQTSDPKLKTNIQSLPSMLDLVSDINPVTFNWISGGYDPLMVEQEQEVQEVEIQEWDEETVEIRNGVPVLTTKRQRHEVPVYDDVQVEDESGKPQHITIPAEAEIRDMAGKIVRPGKPARYVPRMHRVPRMVKKLVATKTMVEHEGKRTHWGFLAPEIKSAFEKIGIDFGGYVKAPDGTECLRPDQLIAPLWKAVQELNQKVIRLQQQLANADLVLDA